MLTWDINGTQRVVVQGYSNMFELMCNLSRLVGQRNADQSQKKMVSDQRKQSMKYHTRNVIGKD